jgi:hypothetical protein
MGWGIAIRTRTKRSTYEHDTPLQYTGLASVPQTEQDCDAQTQYESGTIAPTAAEHRHTPEALGDSLDHPSVFCAYFLQPTSTYETGF